MTQHNIAPDGLRREICARVMNHYELSSLHPGERYLEFLRVPALSAGVYVLRAGETDSQRPHREDEIYYVTSGRGVIRVGTEDRPVESGSVVYVAPGVEHRFHSITEELRVLVVFAPAESSPPLPALPSLPS